MSVEGTWKNSYGSVMQLAQTPEGLVYGLYGSSTGSSGVYRVAGWTGAASDAGTGQALGLSLFWRSMEGGAGDPSWHWVSAFAGQAVELGGVPSLVLNHDLVATVDFPDLAPPGSYLDKLVYVPSDTTTSVIEPLDRTARAADPIDGLWDGGGLSVELALVDASSGLCTGTLTIPGTSAPVVGFVDSYASSTGIHREGVTWTARLGSEVLTFSGWLDLGAAVLSGLTMQSRGTSPGNAYVQTSARGIELRRR